MGQLELTEPPVLLSDAEFLIKKISSSNLRAFLRRQRKRRQLLSQTQAATTWRPASACPRIQQQLEQQPLPTSLSDGELRRASSSRPSRLDRLAAEEATSRSRCTSAASSSRPSTKQHSEAKAEQATGSCPRCHLSLVEAQKIQPSSIVTRIDQILGRKRRQERHSDADQARDQFERLALGAVKSFQPAGSWQCRCEGSAGASTRRRSSKRAGDKMSGQLGQLPTERDQEEVASVRSKAISWGDEEDGEPEEEEEEEADGASSILSGDSGRRKPRPRVTTSCSPLNIDLEASRSCSLAAKR